MFNIIIRKCKSKWGTISYPLGCYYQKPENNKYWQGYKESESPVHCKWNVKWFIAIENSTWFLKELNTKLYDLAIPLLEYTQKNWKARTLNRYLCTHVHSTIIHNSQKVETAQMSTDGWMDKQNFVYTYNGILFILKRIKLLHILQQ